jgi:hypothetical protein
VNISPIVNIAPPKMCFHCQQISMNFEIIKSLHKLQNFLLETCAFCCVHEESPS